MVETIKALKTAVESGRALYVGISSYSPEQTREAIGVAQQIDLKVLIHQPNYSMFDRWIESDLQRILADAGVGSIAFAPLAQGLLSTKYLNGVPAGSRMQRNEYLSTTAITNKKIAQIIALNEIAKNRDQTLPQMAIAWVLRDDSRRKLPPVTSALIGASKPEQIIENVAALKNLSFSDKELVAIDKILAADKEIEPRDNPWKHMVAEGQSSDDEWQRPESDIKRG
jgi:L-glyceraldehyde 3-phosphate reductase